MACIQSLPSNSSLSWFMQSSNDLLEDSTWSPGNDEQCESNSVHGASLSCADLYDQWQRECGQTYPWRRTYDAFDVDLDSDSECESEFFDDVDDDDDDGIIFVRDPEPVPEELAPPFWFAAEDNVHVTAILATYAHVLQLNTDRPFNSRAPLEFVGKVHRQPVFGTESFTTLDRVEVYHRSEVTPGDQMPLVRNVYLLTVWDTLDGLPATCHNLDPRSQLFWQGKAYGTPSPALYQEPVLGCIDEWQTSTSHQDRPVTYYNVPLHKASKGNTLHLF